VNIVFWILLLLGALAVYFVMSYVFDIIGNVGMKMYKIFNKNLGIKRRKK
jgi:hypothetical protein